MDEDKKKDAELPPLLSRFVDAAVWARTNSDLVWDRQADGGFRAGLVLKWRRKAWQRIAVALAARV
ncbi:hypothetical protein SAMN06272771_5393 [Streptomyces sp. Ag82_O1-12]|uniref:hypothetical protein n=1 Tax=unclassified Streptomyces TaxID=2593676 RepID=UPI000BD8A684|nr:MULTISPECIES: hypothetical protein [unclassified Streptomyces]SMQ18930.1 hypothetical protein SAMN06272771_5393 [Streptomyces sp. Ag82_O1-12]SOD47972.1 hypothetical protein SAMN06272727_5396 [Streptomyces sp. Ag82_G6-1]